MRAWLVVLALLVGLVGDPVAAVANCTVQTIWDAYGRMTVCTTCCYSGGVCNTICN